MRTRHETSLIKIVTQSVRRSAGQMKIDELGRAAIPAETAELLHDKVQFTADDAGGHY